MFNTKLNYEMKELKELKSKLEATIHTRCLIITPEVAEQMLRTSIGNRPLRKGNLNSLERAIKKGNWDPCCAPIAIDKDGHLFDGHHRLQAVVNTGIPIVSFVSEGWDPDARYIVDSGAARTMSDHFTMHGVPNPCIVSTVVAAVKLMEAGHQTLTNRGAGARLHRINIAPKDCISFYYKNETIYQAAAKVSSRVRSRLKGIFTPKEVGLQVAYVLLHCGAKEAQVDEFWENVMASNGMYEKLRSKFIRDGQEDRRSKMNPTERLNCIAQVWNAYHTGNKINRILIQREEMQFV